MKRIFCFCLCVLLLGAAGYAQKGTHRGDLPYGTLGFGVGFQEFDAINDRIENYPQYRTLPDYTLMLQLGWIKEKNRVVSIFNVTGASSLSGDRDKRSSAVSYLGVGADIGYDLLEEQRMMLYPFAGIGYEMYWARFYKDVSGVEFDDVLESPSTQNGIRSLDLKNAFFNYRLGLGFMVKSPRNPSKMIGLQAGYTGSFKDHTWRSSENQILENAPEENLGRFHVSLVLGSQPHKYRHK